MAVVSSAESRPVKEHSLKLFANQTTNFWQVVRNIGWMATEKTLRMGGSLLVGTIVVRYLGPEQFGAFSYAYAIFALFNNLSNCGLDYLVVRNIALAANEEAEAEVLGTAFSLKALASIVTTLTAVLYTYVVRPSDTTTVIIVTMLSVAAIAQGFDVVDFFFQAKTKSHLAVRSQLIVFVVISLVRVVAVLSKCSLLFFGFIAALEILVSQLALALTYWISGRNLRHWNFSRTLARGLLRESWPLMISGLLVMIYMRTDQILLGTLATKEVVGQYSAAVKLSELWYALPMIICASVMPRLLKHLGVAQDIYYSRLQRLYNLMGTLSIAIAIGVSVFGRYVILLLFGAKYLDAARILSVHIWTGPFVFIGVVGGMQMIHENLTRLMMLRSAVGAVTNIVLNILLIPHFGAIGSAFATLLAQALSSYLVDAFNRDTRHIFRMKTRALFLFWHPNQVSEVSE